MNNTNQSPTNEPKTKNQQLKTKDEPTTNNQQPTTILQFGGGVFLRAFLGSFVEEANQRFGANESIAIVERSRSQASEILAAQNYEYTVIAQGIVSGAEVREAMRIRAVSEVIAASDNWRRVLEIAASETLRVIVSNTTEAGIVYDESDRESIQSGVQPESFPAKLLVCLHHRWKMNSPQASNDEASELIILPTELIANNATTLKNIVVQLLTEVQYEAEFRAWLDKNVRFCNTLVDRIVPGTPDEISLTTLEAWLGYNDKALITAEPYRLWAIEGDEAVHRAIPFAACPGVIVKPDIQEERTLKVRILNAGHTLMAPRAMAKGIETVVAAMQDNEISSYIENVLRTEVALALDYETSLVQEYISQVLDRFRNPFLQHKLSAIRNGEEMKFKMRVQPSIDGYIQKFGRKPILTIDFVA